MNLDVAKIFDAKRSKHSKLRRSSKFLHGPAWDEPKAAPCGGFPSIGRALAAILVCSILAGAQIARASAPDDPVTVPEWTTKSMLDDIPCHDQIPEYAFTLDPRFSKQNALILLIASWLGHSTSPQRIEEQLAAWGFEHVWFLGKDVAGVKGYIAEHRDFFLLSFRGTESRADSFADSFFSTIPAHDLGVAGSVHMGLYLRFKTFVHALDSILDARQGLHKPLIIAGHSLGGATALLAALHRMHRGDPLLMLYTFAQLRLGNETFRQDAEKKLRGRYYRVFHTDDMTPQVPPSRAAAREFAGMIGPHFPELRKAITGLVIHLDYGQHAGQAYTFTGDDIPLSREKRSELQIELEYWRTLQKELGGLRSPIDINTIYQQHFAHHVPYYYICHMLHADLTAQ